MRAAIGIFLFFWLLVGNVNASFISIPGVVGTGTGNFNTIDPAYTFVTTPQPIGGPYRFTNPNPAWGTDNHWIGPANGNITGYLGTYIYRLAFDLSNFNIANGVTVQGTWATDNGGEILINSIDTGLSRPGTPGIPIVPADFTLSNFLSPQPGIAKVNFLAGINTIDFVVTDTGTVDNPTGLLVTNVSSFASLIPEPNTLILLITGFVGMLNYSFNSRNPRKAEPWTGSAGRASF